MTTLEPIATSLSVLPDHDWHILSSRWSRGVDWNINKVGKKHWEIAGRLGQGVQLFRTKTAAWKYGSNLICLESHHRAWVWHCDGAA